VSGKTRKRNQPAPETKPGPGTARPRVLFAVGDADCLYSENRIWRLVKRLQEQNEWEVISVTSDESVRKTAAEMGIPIALVPLAPRQPTWDEQLATVNELINKTADIVIPGSRLPLWKPLAPDEFRGSMVLFGAQPDLSIDVDLAIVPLMCVDNNTLTASGLYACVVAQARARRIPVLALEVSPLGNRYTMSQLPADHYLVKSHWSKNFLSRQGMASPERISILRPEESSMLRPGTDSYVEAYLEKESLARRLLQLNEGRLIVLIPHHVAFIWEVRRILNALAELAEPLTVIIQANRSLSRRQFSEPELIAKAYEPEIRRLSHVVINTQVGIGLAAQIADLVISPFAGTATEGAALRRTPAIICQLMTEASSDGEFLCWQPDPAKIPELIRSFRERGLVGRVNIEDAVRRLLGRRARQAA
jgi:hypothetical protein